MKYLSVCSGVEAATVAWHDLGFEPVAFSEIEKFPSEVLNYHYPNVPNLGDMTKYKEWNLNDSIDLLVGGTPCQSFSVAGLRKGLEDPRGNLMLTYVGILDKFRPQWCVWENVPGVLSSNGGRDFGSFLGALVELGYGFSYRVLDAQHFGVPQRRRRVFVVGCLGNWISPAKVLFEPESLRRNNTKGKGTKQSAPAFTSSSFGGYGEGVGTIRASGGDLGGGSETLVAHAVATKVRNDPTTAYLAVEVHVPGIGALMNMAEKNESKNLKIIREDAHIVLGNLIPDKSLDAIHLYFPDPIVLHQYSLDMLHPTNKDMLPCLPNLEF